MYKQIITTKQDNINVNVPIPNEWKGVEIAVIAFPIYAPEEPKKEISTKERREKLDAFLDQYLIDLSNFKFNRDEANDYD